MGLVRVPHAHVQQALVVPAHVVELRDRHEQRAAHRSDLVLHRPLLVPGVGVAERVGEPVVGGEGREQIRRADDSAYLPADPGRVVEDDLAGHAAYVLEHGRKPLADAFGGLAVEHLSEAHVGEREGADQVVHAGSHADDPEVGLAEVDLHLARGPILVEVLGARSPVLLLAALDVALDRRVGALEAMLRGKALEDAPGRVALLMPILAILLEPLVDQGSVVVQHRGRPSFCGDLRREVPHPDVFAHRRLRDVGFPGYLGYRRAVAMHLSNILYHGHLDHFLSDLLCRRLSNDNLGHRGRVGVPLVMKPEIFA